MDTKIGGFVDGAEYDSTAKKILMKHGETTVAEVDATAFIKDGMVSSVEIEDGNLVITFNTDAGLDPIEIPLTDIFDPANYYDKDAADETFVAKEAGKGLSTEDYTTAEKAKLGGIATGAQVNVIETVKVNGTALTPQDKAVDIPVPTLDDAVTSASANGVKSSGIWATVWGALTALPTGFSSLYDWCVDRLAGKRDKDDLDATGTLSGSELPFGVDSWRMTVSGNTITLPWNSTNSRWEYGVYYIQVSYSAFPSVYTVSVFLNPAQIGGKSGTASAVSDFVFTYSNVDFHVFIPDKLALKSEVPTVPGDIGAVAAANGTAENLDFSFSTLYSIEPSFGAGQIIWTCKSQGNTIYRIAFPYAYAATPPLLQLALLSDIPATMAWSAITGKPTTLLGYGITDAASAGDLNTAKHYAVKAVALENGAGMLEDRTFNTLALTDSAVALSLPDTTGQSATVLDFALWLDCTNLVSGGSVSIAMPQTGWRGDELPTPEAGKAYIISFTWMGNVWLVHSQEAAQQGGGE